MCGMKVITLGDAVKCVKNLLTTLGIAHWYVFMSDCSQNYSENSKIVPLLGDHYKINTAFIVSDPVELFIDQEQFLFQFVG